jgi:hypothetical protein
MNAPCDGSLRRDRTARAGSCRNRAAGPLQAGHTSPASGPAAAARRVTLFTFTVMEPRGAAAASARRVQLAEHVEGLLGARIVTEHVVQPGRVRVTVATARPVSVDAAKDHASEWPGYVQGSFRASCCTVAEPRRIPRGKR